MTSKVTRVLVADSDEQMRNLVHLTLGQETFAVVEAAHPEAALRAAATWDLDLIILAHDLPSPGALAVVKALRAEPETADIAIMLVTDKAVPPDMSEFNELGVDAVLSKPFGAFTLLKRCDALRRSA